MKINGKFVKREVLGDIILVPVGQTALEFSGMITVNEAGLFIWNLLEQGKSEDEIIAALTEEYEVEPETARDDYRAFLQTLIQNKFVSE